MLTIIERCDDAKQRDEHLVKFVKVKKRLADLAPGNPKIEAKARWRKLEQLTERTRIAATLTQSVFEKFRLPKVET